MHLGDLPFELQLKVVQLCSRRDWASLSRTHTSLRDAADYALYSHIPFRSLKFRQGFPFKAALQTLATNVHKASLVRVLDVQLTLYRSDLHFLEIMAEMLPNMFNLYKLRIAVSNHGIQEKFWRSGISGRINQAIRGGCFRLRLLCLEESQCHWEDIKRIVASQPTLRLLGFHRRNKIYKSLLTISKMLHRDPSSIHPMPMIFMLDFYEVHNRTIVELLPSYHRPGEALEVFTEIETCLNNSLQDKDMYILSLNLFGISKENIDLLREVMEAVATCRRPSSFRGLNIIVHQTSIHSLWQFPEFVKPLTLFPRLETLTFRFRYVLKATELRELSTDMRSCLVKSNLETLCPNLQNIEFWCKWNQDLQKLLHPRPQWLPVSR